MKNIIITLILILLIAPTTVGAHGGDTTNTDTGFGMMRIIEDRALGDELHEEMENLMVKMMSGSMTEAEAERLVVLMEENPGAHGMMMGRIMGMNISSGNLAFGQPSGMMSGRFNTMMPFGGIMGSIGNLWAWVMILATLIWLVVGVLAVAWLWKQVNKN